jgi:hypothetical protein
MLQALLGSPLCSNNKLDDGMDFALLINTGDSGIAPYLDNATPAVCYLPWHNIVLDPT